MNRYYMDSIIIHLVNIPKFLSGKKECIYIEKKGEKTCIELYYYIFNAGHPKKPTKQQFIKFTSLLKKS